MSGFSSGGALAAMKEQLSTKGASIVAYGMRTVQDKLGDVISPLDSPYNAKGDGSDDTAALAAMFAAAKNGQIIDLGGKSYAVFASVAGAANGDAIAIGGVPRLYGKSNITIRNGTIYAANPAASGVKLRFPSTLTIDGCADITLDNVNMVAKGENYGDSDSSQPLDYEARRPYLAQNGGHACAVIRSARVKFTGSCSIRRAGSVGALYVSSSDAVVVNNAYASAESLGYAAFAADGWCGGSVQSGFPSHRLYLVNCRVDRNGADYSSKICVAAEDRDTYVYVQGGVYKDAYPNGATHTLGAAFSSNGSKVFVSGGEVENCAALGSTTNNIVDDTVLQISGVKARGLRTTMHIFNRTSYGAHKVKYQGCYAEIAGTVTWPELELSRSSVVANLKTSSEASIDIIDCVTTGAHTFAINTAASYGGVRVIGGDHTVVERIFDSAGWGGASAGSGRGYEVGNSATFRITIANPANASNALTYAGPVINAIKNQDGQGVYTYQLVSFDKTVSIYASAMLAFVQFQTLGNGLLERSIFEQSLSGCYQTMSAGRPRRSGIRYVKAEGVAGSNVKVVIGVVDGKTVDNLTLIDDVMAIRRIQGIYSGPTVVGNEVQYGIYLNGGAYNLTVGTVYSADFRS